MIDMDTIAEVTRAVSREGLTHEFGTARLEIESHAAWDKVRETGTRLWLDTGDIAAANELWCSQFEALTTNNTLLNREVQKGIFDDFVGKVASAIKEAVPEIDDRQLLLEISFVLNCRHGLRLVDLFDAHVSVELHTDLADDTERSVAYGLRYFAVCPEMFYVKVPLTPAGLLAARKLGELKVPINFTLGFSARQNYLSALLARPRYVNVFMGRLNSFVIDSGLGDGKNVGEKATLATQREILKLRDAGRTDSMLIGASMRDSSQVASLAGVDVYTLPPKVAAEYTTKPPKEISRQVDADPEPGIADGVSIDDFNGATLWEVPDAFKDCVDQLLRKDATGLTAEDVQGHFADAGFGDLFPAWTDEMIETVTADGKIPDYRKWKDQLAAGEIGMDALMNISALYSFATDQRALDDRVKSLL